MATLIFIIIVSSVITERLLDGLHKFYFTRNLKRYLVGNNDGLGIVHNPILREFIRCKFCQSWWTAWAVSYIMIDLFWTPSWYWVWVGIVVGSLATKLHDLFHSIGTVRYWFINLGGKDAVGNHTSQE